MKTALSMDVNHPQANRNPKRPRELRRRALSFAAVALLLALPCIAQEGDPVQERGDYQLPYYSPNEILVFQEATKQHMASQEYRVSQDYKDWAESVARLFDLAGTLAEGSHNHATTLAIAYGRAAVEDLVVFIEHHQSHRGSVTAQQILGDRIGLRAFPLDKYQQRLQEIISRYDRMCADLKDDEGYRSTVAQRETLVAFLRESTALDVEPELVRAAVAPEVEKLVERVTTTANVFEARELLKEDSPLSVYLKGAQKRALRRVAGANG